MNSEPICTDELLTPADVAAILYVDPKTVTRWAIAGKIRAIRTPGGHRRFLKNEILALRHGGSFPDAAPSWPHSDTATFTPPAPSMGGTGRPVPRQNVAEGAERHLAIAEAMVVAEAVARAREAQADVAAQDVSVVARAVMQAADMTAGAAEMARRGRAVAASTAAEAVATDAAQTAAAVQRRADVMALRLTEAASRAAEVVAAAGSPGHERRDAVTALQLAAIVKSAAVVTAEDTAAAAVSVATAVAAAAADVAFMVSAADRAIESEVARAAATLQAVATMTARQMAAHNDERAIATALMAYDTAAAVGSREPAGRLGPDGEPAFVPAQVPARSAIT